MFCKISFLVVFVAVCFGSPAGSLDQIAISPETATKEIGEVAQILCIWKNEPLMQCIFKLPQEGNQHKKISLIENYSNNDSSISYYGEGMQKGECGVSMTVEEKYHGAITCELTSRSGQFVEATMKLVVAKKPKEPVLTLDSDTYVEGNNVTAICEVAEGRPAAVVTWAFQGKENFNTIIKQQRKRTVKPVGTTTTVIEQVVWTVTGDDDQKLVTCAAEHHSWKKSGPKVANKTITVHYKPRIFNEKNELAEDVLYPNLVLGEAATVTVKTKSNPAPNAAEMTIHNTTLGVGQVDEKYEFSELKQENGYHLYSLIIKNLTKEDLHQVCMLNVSNSVGSGVARLTFSTRPQNIPDTAGSTEKPKDRAVAGSTMTGIIIAVCLIIIITVAVVMFAKFNKKWCFASKPPVHTAHLVPSE